MISSKYKYSQCIAWQIEPINDFVYIHNLQKHVFVNLDGVSKDIWLMINDSKTTEEMIFYIANEYGICQEIAKKDIDDLLYELKSEGVIEEDGC